MSLPYNRTLIPRARELRKAMTPQERKLWYGFLKEYPVRFQRQKTISSFIVDFYCHRAKIAIEVDGSQHYSDDGRVYDSERSDILKSFGLKILRYSNHDVDRNFNNVCEDIRNQVTYRLSKLPHNQP